MVVFNGGWYGYALCSSGVAFAAVVVAVCEEVMFLSFGPILGQPDPWEPQSSVVTKRDARFGLLTASSRVGYRRSCHGPFRRKLYQS